MLATRSQIRASVLATTKQSVAQIGDLVNDLINITLQEIASPVWAYRTEKYHLWSWLKRKTTFTASSEDTILERDVDKIALLRQTDSPTKIEYIRDEDFYRELPDTSETGDPRLYRLWEVYLDYLGVDADKIHKNAEEIEHSLSSDLEDKLEKLLSNPKKDPHDQPIPEKISTV